MLTLQLPETSYKLVVQDSTLMYIRAVEVLIGGIRHQLNQCEKRILPLFAGEDSDDMERVNLLRLMGAIKYIERCRTENLQTSILHEIRLHLSPERNGWHTMFEVRIVLGEAQIHVCNPSWSVNAMHRMMSIEV